MSDDPAGGRESVARRGLAAADIMVVDADPLDADKIERALSALVNRVTVFNDPSEAADYLMRRGRYAGNRRTPDLLILDAELMGEGCWEVIRDLRERPEYEDTAVVVVEDDPPAGHVMKAREVGADHFESKPVSMLRMAQLVARQRHLDMAVVRRSILHDARQ